jgi:hypothetical protein
MKEKGARLKHRPQASLQQSYRTLHKLSFFRLLLTMPSKNHLTMDESSGTIRILSAL